MAILGDDNFAKISGSISAVPTPADDHTVIEYNDREIKVIEDLSEAMTLTSPGHYANINSVLDEYKDVIPNLL